MPRWLFYLAAIRPGVLTGLAGLSPLLCLYITATVDADEL